MATLAERLLAGEHHGELSWSAVARKWGINEKSLYIARKAVEARTGKAPSLCFLDEIEHEINLKVHKPAADAVSLWPSVEAFDREPADDQAADNQAAHSLAPDGYTVKGVSTYYDADGVVRSRWVKTKQEEADRLAVLERAIARLADEWPSIAEPTPAPSGNEDLMAVYMMGDPHLGLFSWSQETGQDFDLGIAERTLVGAADQLVGLAPAARQALVVNVGDFFHSDNSSNRTMRSGHALDVDTRWAKVMQVGVRTMRRIIDRALEKHETVRVVNAIGNHDDHSSIMLSIALAQFYEREPRVEIDTSPSKFHWHRFGKTLIGVTHGDTVKANDLPGVMACDRAQDWGETLFRYWLCGHIHHDTVKEYAGVVVETLRTMAARDNWSHAAGYRSGRDMKCDVYHRQWGRIVRHTVGVHQLEAA